tara:strand:+ start:1503 stop:1670 length:168 start_codon:yes stop_codon:yes gene_type:complete
MEDEYLEQLAAMLARTSNGTVSAEEIRRMLDPNAQINAMADSMIGGSDEGVNRSN